MACKPPTCTGEMEHLVLVQSPVRVPDGAGGFLNDEWEDKDEIYCKITRSNGGEGLGHNMIEAPATSVFWTRYGSPVTVKDRLCFDDKAFNIRSVENYEYQNEFLKITAEEGVLD